MTYGEIVFQTKKKQSAHQNLYLWRDLEEKHPLQGYLLICLCRWNSKCHHKLNKFKKKPLNLALCRPLSSETSLSRKGLFLY